MSRMKKQNLHNIKCMFEEKTGVDLNPAHHERNRLPARTLVVLAAAMVLCFALAAFAVPVFSPLNGDELSLSGTYLGDGIVSVYVENKSDKVLEFQQQVKLYNWGTGEEIPSTGPAKIENALFPAHSSGTMTVDLSNAYDVKALEAARPADTHTFYYYLLLTNQDFLFGQDWMCSFTFAGEEVLETIPEKPKEETLPPAPVEGQIAEDIEEELRFYFEDSYKNQLMVTNEANFEYMQKVQELLARFDGTVVPPVEPMLIAKRLPEGVVLDESHPMELQYQLVGQYHHIIDGYGRIVAGFNSPTGFENALTLGAFLPQHQGETDGGAEIPLIYMFTYEVSAIEEDSYAFIYGQILSFAEMERYKVYEDDQYAVYEVTDLFYTDLDAYLDFFLTTRDDIYCDDQIRQRVHNVYDYYKDRETLGSMMHYHLPGLCEEIP